MDYAAVFQAGGPRQSNGNCSSGFLKDLSIEAAAPGERGITFRIGKFIGQVTIESKFIGQVAIGCKLTGQVTIESKFTGQVAIGCKLTGQVTFESEFIGQVNIEGT
jgi:hypothetical protein